MRAGWPSTTPVPPNGVCACCLAGMDLKGVPFGVSYTVVIAVMMYSHLLTTSKTVRTLILLPIIITMAKALGWPPIAFALPAALCIDWVVGLAHQRQAERDPVFHEPVLRCRQLQVRRPDLYPRRDPAGGVRRDLVSLARADAFILGGCTMKRLFIALMLICSVAGATVIDRYATELDVHADGGSRATVTLDLKNCQAGRFVLPVGFGGMGRFEVQAAPDGVVLKPVPGKESSTLEIELPPGIAASTSLRFAFAAPDVLGRPKMAAGEKAKPAADTQLLRHSFVNTGSAGNRRLRTFGAVAGRLAGAKDCRAIAQAETQRRLAACSPGPHGWPPGRRPSTRQHEAGRPDLDGAQCGFGPPFLWVAAGRPGPFLAYLVGFRSLVKADPSLESQSAQPS